MPTYQVIGYDDIGRVVEVSSSYRNRKSAEKEGRKLISKRNIHSVYMKVSGKKKNPCGTRSNPRPRTTVDEYEIQGAYGSGWEMVTTEETLKAAREQLRCYNENEPYPHRIVKRRVKI